jgi:serine/threonine protein kinase/Tol biopolymer transport system component
MALSAGTRVGPYQILVPLGAGGMGEVYRARDTRLNRDVAIKVLPDLFARDPERLARFQREAQVLASLNHPHIAHIHGLEETGGVRALVMELVEGDNLAQRIARGAIPLDDALAIAMQIAEALEAAHEQGIIHRDLKPANVKVRPDGTVKVLDFGLAKALDRFSSSSSEAALANSPTVASPATDGRTAVGVILGTAAYMSPEQAAGKPVDRRSDLWAFGVVVMEMLTGRPVFTGETVAHVLASVLKIDPDWTALPPETPAPMRKLLRRCLEKDRKRRLDSAADARLEIDEALTSIGDDGAVTTVTTPGAAWRRVLPWSVAAILAIAASVATWLLKGPTPQPPVRLAINLPPGQRLAALNQPALAISPDGKNLVYVAVQGRDSNGATTNQGQPAIQQLYVRPLESLEARPVSGTEGAVSPFFSPDGQWIGFFAGGQLKKVSVNGGAAVTLAIAPHPGGGSWSSQGTLALQLRQTGQQGLQQISPEGGAPQPLTRLGKGEFIHRWPKFLPGGHALLFVGSATGATWGRAHVAVETIREGEQKNPSGSLRTILAQGTQPHYAPTGHLVYAQSGTLMAAPFDARRLALKGAAVPALEGVMQFNTTGAAQYSLSSTGTLVYVAGKLDDGQSRLVWVSRNGEEQPLAAAPQNYVFPRVSPDGRQVAVEILEQEEQTWVYDVSRDHLTRLAFEGTVNNVPAWSPDGKRIAFSSNRSGVASNLFWALADGSGGAERLAASDSVNFPNSFSRDAQLLAYVEVTLETGSDIWVLRMSDRKGQPFLQAPYEETAPAFSPDGRWLAYSSNESGRREINVRPYPGPGGRWQISTEGGQEPMWNPRGGELFYRSGRRIMAVDVDTTSGFSAGKPRMLFEGPYLPGGGFPFYDVSPDGQRFLMLKPVEYQTSAPTQINVTLNWFEELKRLVPGK